MVKWVRVLPLLLVFVLMIAIAPVVASDSTHAKSVVAGEDCSFAIMEDGTVWAWGDNARGQLGIGSREDQEFPVQVPIDHVTALSSAFGNTMALKADGTVWAWGDNTWGQLGDGTFTESDTPVKVAGLDRVTAVAVGGGHCLALKDDGTLWAWGRGLDGQLGIGLMSPMTPDGGRTDNISVLRPTKVDISDVVAIACGTSVSVALKADGTVWQWGERTATPAQVPISDVTRIAAGGDTTLAQRADGTVWSWSVDTNVIYGNDTILTNEPSPVLVERLSNVSAFSTGGRASYAIAADRRVLAWGINDLGSLGDGRYGGETARVPQPVLNLTDVRSIAAGFDYGLAAEADGTVWAWGANDAGQLGIGTFDVQYYYPNGTIVSWKSVSADGTVTNNVPAPTLWFTGRPAPVHVLIGERPIVNRTEYLPLPLQAGQVVPANTLRPANVSLSDGGGWAVGTEAAVQYLTQGENGDIYAFAGNEIRCLGPDGTLKWDTTVPVDWTVCLDRQLLYHNPRPTYALSNGTLYLYLVPNVTYTSLTGWYENYFDTAAKGMTWAVAAISPDGRIAWTHPLDMFPEQYDSTSVSATGDRVYVYHGYNETVLDREGNALFEINNVAGPAAVDGRGNVYLADAVPDPSGGWTGHGYADYRKPGRIVEAYGPDGSPLWRKDVGDDIQRNSVGETTWNYLIDDVRTKYGTLPICQNDTLYVPTMSGVVALGANGSVRWSRTMDYGTYRLFPLMPVDDYGNVYLESLYVDNFDFTSDIYVITGDGRDVSPPRKYAICGPAVVARDGVIYDLSYDLYAGVDLGYPLSLDNMTRYAVRAYDIVNDRVLWAYTIPADGINYVVLDRDNIYSLLSLTARAPREWGMNHALRPILSDDQISLQLSGDTLYVIAREANYEVPIVPGKSRYAYSAGIYAISTRGDIAYEKPTSQIVTAACVNNSTVIIATGNGGISTVAIGIVAAGLTLLGAIAIGAKLFLFGTVTRARGRLDKNANRNQVLAYVRDNPGNTLHEISRGMQMNLGTTRYHLFILGANHKIATFNDGKFVRYFPNSNFYNKEEQLLISLLRRENTKLILRSLIASPGQTNAELSQRLGQPHSAINVYLKELSAKGIAIRENAPGGRSVYAVESRYRGLIVSLSQRLGYE